ncbi:unnamed protein product, partial [Strongylus vulgaris]
MNIPPPKIPKPAVDEDASNTIQSTEENSQVTAQMNIPPPKIPKPAVDEDASNTIQSTEENSQGEQRGGKQFWRHGVALLNSLRDWYVKGTMEKLYRRRAVLAVVGQCPHVSQRRLEREVGGTLGKIRPKLFVRSIEALSPKALSPLRS